MKPDRECHGCDGDDGNLPEIAALLHAWQAERFDNMQPHQQHQQNRQDFRHNTPVIIHPCANAQNSPSLVGPHIIGKKMRKIRSFLLLLNLKFDGRAAKREIT